MWTPPYHRSSKSHCRRASGQRLNPPATRPPTGWPFPCIDTTASFVYNENGLRVQKTVNGEVTNYTPHGKNVVHMTKGDDELHFFYDAGNKPSIVEYAWLLSRGKR